MENWEVQEIKDSLVMMKYELEGSKDGEMLDKAFEYINELEERLVEIANSKTKAIKLLRENNYIVKKLTKGQLEDAKSCEDCGFEGECSECSCSVCIIQ